MPLQGFPLQDFYLCSDYKKANQLWSKKYPHAAHSENWKLTVTWMTVLQSSLCGFPGSSLCYYAEKHKTTK